MFPHHQRTIDRVVEIFQSQPDVIALLLGGSIAHGFAGEGSDVDVMIVVSDEEHRRRTASGELQYFTMELCDYAGGYVDGKFFGPSFLDEVERHGSEPARFAFADARVLFSRSEGLADQIARIARYPTEQKEERIRRFSAQFEAWMWYAGEADKRRNSYLMGVAATKLVLFGGRMVLAHNELLYPFHKWFFAMVEKASQKPEGLVEAMTRLSQDQTLEHARQLHDLVVQYRTWEADPTPWPNRFMTDTELTWLRGAAAIDDI